jgi:hypothetical protein
VKLLGIDGKNIAGVTRKMKLSDEVPTHSVADMIVEDTREHVVSGMLQAHEAVHDAEDDPDVPMRRTLARPDSFFTEQRKKLMRNMFISFCAIIAVILIVVLESTIKGEVVNTEALVKTIRTVDVGTLQVANVTGI